MNNNQVRILKYLINSKKNNINIMYRTNKFSTVYIYKLFNINRFYPYQQPLIKFKQNFSSPYVSLVNSYIFIIIKDLNYNLIFNVYLYLAVKMYFKELINLLQYLSYLKNIKVLYSGNNLVKLNKYFNIYAFKKKHINQSILNYIYYQKIDIILNNNSYPLDKFYQFSLNINISNNIFQYNSIIIYILFLLCFNKSLK